MTVDLETVSRVRVTAESYYRIVIGTREILASRDDLALLEAAIAAMLRGCREHCQDVRPHPPHPFAHPRHGGDIYQCGGTTEQGLPCPTNP
jgi:hypothetical protein